MFPKICITRSKFSYIFSYGFPMVFPQEYFGHRGKNRSTEVLRGVDRSRGAAEGHGGAEQGAPRGKGAHGGHDLAARVLPAAAWRNLRRNQRVNGTGLFVGRFQGNIIPIGSMYGIFTYIGIILNYFRGQWRYIFHTWILWDREIESG